MFPLLQDGSNYETGQPEESHRREQTTTILTRVLKHTKSMQRSHSLSNTVTIRSILTSAGCMLPLLLFISKAHPLICPFLLQKKSEENLRYLPWTQSESCRLRGDYETAVGMKPRLLKCKARVIFKQHLIAL